MPKNDVLDLVLAQDNQFHDGTEQAQGYFASARLEEDDTLTVTLDYGNRTEEYIVFVQEVN